MQTRRDFLYTGLFGGLGLSLGTCLKLQAESGAAAKAQSVIHIFLPGGAAAQETWDPKINAPIEYRGPLNSVATSIPGVHFSEHLAKTAKIADKLTIVRSMTHGEAARRRRGSSRMSARTTLRRRRSGAWSSGAGSTRRTSRTS